MEAALASVGGNAKDMVKDRVLGDWRGLVLAPWQKSKVGWYKKLGFKQDGGMRAWWEEGLEHVGMWRRVEVGYRYEERLLTANDLVR